MTSTAAKPALRERPGSKPDTASPSSLVAVHRASSLSSRPGGTARSRLTGLRSRSPAENLVMSASTGDPTLAGDAMTISPEKKRKSHTVYTRPDSRQGSSEGPNNLNRWSQSTGSSNTDASQKRRGSLSKRLSGAVGSFGGFGSSQASLSNGRPTNRVHSPLKLRTPALTALSPPPVHAPTLPPIEALSSLSQAVDSAESPSTPATATPTTADMISPSNTISPHLDYFADRWKARSPSTQLPPSQNMSTRRSRANPPSPLTVDPTGRSPPSRAPESVYSPRASSRFRHERRPSQGAHHRRRADSGKSNGTTEGESSASDHRERANRQHRRRAPSQKALLSKALAKANHAVVLDGRQNVEGAIQAYGDACNLLRQVMVRSSGDDDRRKLETVRKTYKNRIDELRNIDLSYQSSDSKALPDPPPDRDSRETEQLSILTDEDDVGSAPGNGPEALISDLSQDNRYGSIQRNRSLDHAPYIPPRRQSLRPHGNRADNSDMSLTDQPFGLFQTQRHGPTSNPFRPSDDLQPPVYRADIPPPLSPRRPSSPKEPEKEDSLVEQEGEQSEPGRKHEAEHTSWLNTIAESSGSEAASVHSRRSSAGVRRRHIRALRESGETEAEFNAALDAAVEAAYDEGFEPDDDDDEDEQLINLPEYQVDESEPLSTVLRNVELAKENVREAEREVAISQAKERERQRLQQDAQSGRDSLEMEYGDDEAEEEERLLAEMTKDYILDDNEDDGQRKSALPQPRQSGSSGFSGRTWASSNGSNLTSTGTSLTTVAEAPLMPSLASQMESHSLPPQLHPPPSSSLPPPPTAAALSPQAHGVVPRPPSLAIRNSSPGVRDRRLSGKAKQLKIETHPRLPSGPGSDAPKTQQPPAALPMLPPHAIPDPPRSAFLTPDSHSTPPERSAPVLSAVQPGPAGLPGTHKDTSPFPPLEIEPISSATSTLTKVTSADSDTSVPSVPGSPARFTRTTTGLRKNFSSSSLRNKSLNASAPEGQDVSPNTSISSGSSMPKQRGVPSPAVPVIPTPLEASFLPRGQPSGGIYLFDCEIHSPVSPGSPNPASLNPHLALEPCPESTLLRPFWLLRSVYQTIAHPRGGYVTSRLFVPRDIWRVKNIKLKYVEEKVSSCDLLTAALLKLGKVDTYNADAVLEEMQFLDGVMDQVQLNLSKKLGSDVGVHGAVSTFKGMSVVDDSASNSEALTAKSSSTNGKSYLSSWRKLRSKNSLGPTLGSTSHYGLPKDAHKDPLTMKSLPMTAVPNPRFPRRDVSQVQCMGTNPSYMGALARLCDAAQILDQIARQVEDPGLKCSSPTHVGLELCTRHAAEFFAFYICRFIIADIGLMLDKFIKRGSEWVLA